MKRRLAKKQIKKTVGYMTANGFPVVNCVSNTKYTGGSCWMLDEDCYGCEVTYVRRKHGSPLFLRRRWADIYNTIYNRA